MLQVLICLAIILALFEIARGDIESAVARPMPELRKLDDSERPMTARRRSKPASD